MKKNDVFTFTAPNGVEVTGVALYAVTLFDGNDYIGNKWFCYGQNRLFTIREFANGDYIYDDKIVDYAILPDYDEQLRLFEAVDYPLWEQNMETPDPDEGEDTFWDSCVEEHNKQEDVDKVYDSTGHLVRGGFASLPKML